MKKSELKSLIKEVIEELGMGHDHSVLKDSSVVPYIRKISDSAKYRRPISDDDINALAMAAFQAGVNKSRM